MRAFVPKVPLGPLISMEDVIAKTIETYEKIAPYYEKEHIDPDFWLKKFQLFQKLLKGKKVVEIGCGFGRDAELFVKNNFDYVGIDASKNMLKIAHKRVPKGKFLQMNFYNLDFPEETFDGFWAVASLLHVPKTDIAGILKSISKLVKHNGAGFITVKEKRDVEEGVIKQQRYFGSIERYFAFYTKDEFQGLLEKTGFKIIDFSVRKAAGDVWLCFFVKKA